LFNFQPFFSPSCCSIQNLFFTLFLGYLHCFSFKPSFFFSITFVVKF
jgi:hypothetical protein